MKAPTPFLWEKSLCTFSLLGYFDLTRERKSIPSMKLKWSLKIQFSHRSYSKERNFQLLGKSRKTVPRRPETKCIFFLPWSLLILPMQKRRLQSRKLQRRAHHTIFLWETVTSSPLDHNEPNKHSTAQQESVFLRENAAGGNALKL